MNANRIFDVIEESVRFFVFFFFRGDNAIVITFKNIYLLASSYG